MPSASASSLLSLSAAVLVGLLPYFLWGLRIETVNALLPLQIILAAASQLALFLGKGSNSASSVGHALAAWLAGALLWHGLFIVFGAAIVENAVYTFGLASLTAALTAIPVSRLTGYKIHAGLEHWSREHLGDLDRLAKFQSIGVMAGVYSSAIVLPLDWDRPWQVWPCPCVVGAWAGCCVGDLAYRILQPTGHLVPSRKTA